jgi:hypothetical protein
MCVALPMGVLAIKKGHFVDQQALRVESFSRFRSVIAQQLSGLI